MGVFSRLRATWDQIQDDIAGGYAPNQEERTLRRIIDRPGLDGFSWIVWWVSASGFFTTSYAIFSTNVINPALAYVYPDCAVNQALIINVTTLVGTMIGMIIFGYLADRYGRKSIYGAELVIVVIATVGMTTASSGKGDVMDIFGWIGFWRFFLGLGLGAEYPLSAIISAEWSSTRVRAKMLAAVFLMQSLGQLAAYGFGLLFLVLVSLGRRLSADEKDKDIAAPTIDIYWRVVIAVGALPALISIFLRRLLPETPLWLVAKGRVMDGNEALGAVYPFPDDEEQAHHPSHGANHVEDDEQEEGAEGKSRRGRVSKHIRDVVAYLSGSNGDVLRALLGVMAVWFLLDVAFYGLGLDNPRTIATIWLSRPTDRGSGLSCEDMWKADPSQPDITIYNMLKQDTIRNMITISTGTVTGSVIILLVIDYIPRVTWMGCWFLALAGLFLINGSTFFVAYESDTHALTITLYVLAQAMFNLGPNTITFILPAELFNTRYRGTFYGLAAASGKLGAIVIQLIMNLTFPNTGPGRNQFAGLLLGLCPTMLLGALITWVWIPEVQYPRGHTARDDASENEESEDGDPQRRRFLEQLRLPNRPLEDIAADPSRGQIIGVRKNIALAASGFARALGLGKSRKRSGGTSDDGRQGSVMVQQGGTDGDGGDTTAPEYQGR